MQKLYSSVKHFMFFGSSPWHSVHFARSLRRRIMNCICYLAIVIERQLNKELGLVADC